MHRFILRLTGTLMALLSISLAWADNEIYYGVYQGTGSLTNYGTGRGETYELAIHLTDPTLVGMEIRAIRIPVNTNAKNVTDYKAWLTKELTLLGGVTAPDIASVDVTPSGAWTEVRLTEPYVIEEGGLYVGYSFVVSSVDASDAGDANKVPVMTTATENPEGLLIHTSRTYRKWVGLADQGSPAIVAVLGGDGVKENAAVFSAPSNLYTLVGKSLSASLTLINHGSATISNIDYEIEVAGQKESKHLTTSLAGSYYGRNKTQTVTIPAVSERGNYPATFRITKVNGVDNEDAVGETIEEVTWLDEMPVHKPLVEEYTGRWCQYCPRGLAGMEKMDDTNGDMYVGLAYHQGDVMDFTFYLPASPSGLPALFIDRVASFDALTGQNDWQKRRDIIAPANIVVGGEWADEAKTQIRVTSRTTFVRNFSDSPYLITYVLLANDLHGEGGEWAQVNAYSGSSSDDPYLDRYCKMSNPIPNFHFDHIAIAFSQVGGGAMPESLPTSVQADVPYEHTFTFDISANTLPLVKDKMDVVVILLNKETGEVVNCNKSHVIDADGIRAIDNAQSAMDNYPIYDLSGRRVSDAVKGIYIQNGKKIVK